MIRRALEELISIHAPRTGSDRTEGGIRKSRRNISIHAPRTGSDIKRTPCRKSKKFQSTLPARGATSVVRSSQNGGQFQSTLPARGATCSRCRFSARYWHFNPRSPHGERPAQLATSAALLAISIHAPRTGSDEILVENQAGIKHFNPRSPCGERPRKVTILSIRIIGFAQKVYHKTVLLRISLAENAVILPEKPRNPVRTSLQKAGGLRFARAIRAARPYSISNPSGA